MTVKIEANFNDEIVSTFDINISAPQSGVIITFDWSYSEEPYSDAQFYYSINGGNVVYFPFSIGGYSANLDISINQINQIKVGILSSKTFDDYEDEPDDYDMKASLYQGNNLLSSRRYYAGTTNNCYLTGNVISEGSNEIYFIVEETD